jgi:hypothetical protein
MNNPLNLIDPLGLDPPSIQQICGSQPTAQCSHGYGLLISSQYWGQGNGPRGNRSPYDSFTFFFNTGYWTETPNGPRVFVWDPLAVYSLWGNDIGSGAANNGVTASISAVKGYEGSKKQYCDQQSNKAFIESILPGGHVLFGGDYRPSTVGGAAAGVAVDRAIDIGAKTTSFLYGVRSLTGIPMSVTSKLLSGASLLLTAKSVNDAVNAMQKEYRACMEN